jgi:tRNA(fMet)-specific endonuclease VapC
MRFLLDTNVLSELMRRPNGRVQVRLSEVGEASVCTSVIVAAELLFGAEKARSSALRERVAALVASLEVLPVGRDVARHYAEIRSTLESIGQPIGPNDLWIAAHARTLNLTVVSANTREFARVPGLSVEDWTQ